MSARILFHDSKTQSQTIENIDFQRILHSYFDDFSGLFLAAWVIIIIITTQENRSVNKPSVNPALRRLRASAFSIVFKANIDRLSKAGIRHCDAEKLAKGNYFFSIQIPNENIGFCCNGCLLYNLINDSEYPLNSVIKLRSIIEADIFLHLDNFNLFDCHLIDVWAKRHFSLIALIQFVCY